MNIEPKFTIDQLLNVAKELEPKVAHLNAHVAIGGSCVYRGWSTKDMDLMLYPHTKEPLDREVIVRFLQSLGWVPYYGHTDRQTCVPDVYVSVKDGLRVDFFFLAR